MDKNLIHLLQKYFAGQPVEKAWLFGSFSRGEQTAHSDIDILVKFDASQKVGLFKHASMIDDLQRLLQRAVDLVSDTTIFPWVKSNVDNDKILIYERKAP